MQVFCHAVLGDAFIERCEIAFRANVVAVAEGLLHPLSVDAVADGQCLSALVDRVNFVEAGVDNALVGCGEGVFCRFRTRNGMWTCGLPGSRRETCVGEYGLPVSFLVGHAPQRVVDNLAVRITQVYVGQAVHIVIKEGLL